MENLIPLTKVVKKLRSALGAIFFPDQVLLGNNFDLRPDRILSKELG